MDRGHRRWVIPNNVDPQPYPGLNLPNFDMSLFAECGGSDSDDLVSDEEIDGNEKKTKFCRVCLCNDKRLYPITQKNRTTFREALNRTGRDGKPIPQRICRECNTKMSVCSNFRRKALQTNSLLYSIIRPFVNVSEAPHGPGTSRYMNHRPGGFQSRFYSASENIPTPPRRSTFCLLQGAAPARQYNEPPVTQDNRPPTPPNYENIPPVIQPE